MAEAETAASGVPNYRVSGDRAPCQLRWACRPGLPTVILATSFLTAAGQKYRLPCAPTSFPTPVGPLFTFPWRSNFRFPVRRGPHALKEWFLF